MGGVNNNNRVQPPPGGDGAPSVPAPPDDALLRRRKTLNTVNVIVLGYTLLCLFPFLLTVVVRGPGLIGWMGLGVYAIMVLVAWISEFAIMFFDFVVFDLAIYVGLTGDRPRAWRLGCLWMIVSFVGFVAATFVLALICVGSSAD